MMNRDPDFAWLQKDWGIVSSARGFMEPAWRRDITIALDAVPELALGADLSTLGLDAQPAMQTVPSYGVPAYLTMLKDPEVVRVLQSPNKGAEIYGETKKGDWTSQTESFLVVENVGDVASYGDYDDNGRSDVNASFPQRQSYHFQTFLEYGDREVDIMGLTSLNWVAEKQIAAAKTLQKFMDLTYHFGVAGLQNYGMLNDPSLSPALTPSTKQAGGTRWVNQYGVVVATANEVTLDIQSLFSQLVSQTGGLVTRDSALTLVTAPQADVGFLAINSFGNDVLALLQKGFPNLKMKTDPRYATAAGNIVQLIADEFDGNKTAICSFTEKERDHRIIPKESSFRQKKTAGTWGWVGKYPHAVATMLGV